MTQRSRNFFNETSLGHKSTYFKEAIAKYVKRTLKIRTFLKNTEKKNLQKIPN